MLLILKNTPLAPLSIETSLHLVGNHLAKNGTPFTIASFEDIEVHIETNKIGIFVDGNSIDDFTTIFVRKVGVYNATAFILAHYAESHNIQFIDIFRKQTGNRTKLTQMLLLASAGVNVPKTYFSPTYSTPHVEHAITYLQFPIVVKQCSISKGAGVALAHSLSELQEKIAYFKKTSPSKAIILQEFIPNTFEYRIFITGTTIATAEKKTRVDANDFRNNVYLGAREDFFDPSQLKESLATIALKAAQTVGIQVAGVDVVETENGTPIIFEINSCPGFTLDETLSDEVKMLSQYLTLCEKK